MGKNVILVVAILGMMWVAPAFADDDDDFLKGLDAAKAGDMETALKMWKPLADQGYVYAQYNLGLMYSNGRGVDQDYATAVKWYTLAAEQGHAEAQYNLGVHYTDGSGFSRDYKAAMKWYLLAAEQGDALAQTNLGVMYDRGHGVPHDNVRAHMWWNIAASIGGDEDAAEYRDKIAKKMDPANISVAQALAINCVEVKKLNNC